jgi:plasmid maintenance system killer protein
MIVGYNTETLRELAEDLKAATRKFGHPFAKGIAKRIKQLESATCMRDVFPPAPGKWHWLKYDRADTAAGTAKDGLRVIVEPQGEFEDPLDATEVLVVEIGDYH